MVIQVYWREAGRSLWQRRFWETIWVDMRIFWWVPRIVKVAQWWSWWPQFLRCIRSCLKFVFRGLTQWCTRVGSCMTAWNLLREAPKCIHWGLVVHHSQSLHFGDFLLLVSSKQCLHNYWFTIWEDNWMADVTVLLALPICIGYIRFGTFKQFEI